MSGPVPHDHVWTLRTLMEHFPEYLDAPITLGISDAHRNFDIVRPYRGYLGISAGKFTTPTGEGLQLRLDAALKNFRLVKKRD